MEKAHAFTSLHLNFRCSLHVFLTEIWTTTAPSSQWTPLHQGMRREFCANFCEFISFISLCRFLMKKVKMKLSMLELPKV